MDFGLWGLSGVGGSHRASVWETKGSTAARSSSPSQSAAESAGPELRLPAYDAILSQLDTLKRRTDGLKKPNLFANASVSLGFASSNPTAATGSVATGATPGAHAFNITQLATATVRTGREAADLFGPGQDYDYLGTHVGDLAWESPLTSGTINVNGYTVNVDTSRTLKGLFDDIASATGNTVKSACEDIGFDVGLGPATIGPDYAESFKIYLGAISGERNTTYVNFNAVTPTAGMSIEFDTPDGTVSVWYSVGGEGSGSGVEAPLAGPYASAGELAAATATALNSTGLFNPISDSGNSFTVSTSTPGPAPVVRDNGAGGAGPILNTVEYRSSIQGGDYFTLSTPDEDFYVWYEVDMLGSDPLLSGKTGLKVSVSGGYTDQQMASATASALNATGKFNATIVADGQEEHWLQVDNVDPGDAPDATMGNIAAIFPVTNLQQGSPTPRPGGGYFTVDSTDTSSYVWFKVGGQGTDPSVAGRTGIEVDVARNASVEDVAVAVRSALEATGKFSVTIDGSYHTIVKSAGSGAVADLAEVNSGFVTSVATVVGTQCNRIHLYSTDASPVVLSSGTSNFLTVAQLSSGGSHVASAGHVGALDVSKELAWANLLETPNNGGAGAGEFRINGVSIAYDANSDTASLILARINSASAGVTASFDDASGQFALTNKTTGDASVTVQDVKGNLMAAMGLDAWAQTQLGNNLEYTVDGGGTRTSQSNAITAASSGIPGLTVNALTPGTVTLSVTGGPGHSPPNTKVATAAIQKFIAEFNKAQSFIANYTAPTRDAQGNESVGILAEDSAAAKLSQQLRSTVTQEFSSLRSVKNLADLGIKAKDDGTLELSNRSKLQTALATHYSDVNALFTDRDNGLVAQLASVLRSGIDDVATARRNDGANATDTLAIQGTQTPGSSRPALAISYDRNGRPAWRYLGAYNSWA
jgi:hypothetical protein